MKKQYICNWILCNKTGFILDSKYSYGTVYGTSKKVLENQVRFMLKQKYKTKEF